MKSKLLYTLVSSGVLLAGLQSAQVLAQTSIKQVDADIIRVTGFSGKPPHKRLTIDRTTQPELLRILAHSDH